MVLQLYRNAYAGLPRSVWLLAGVMLINRSGTMVLPFLSLYLTQHLHFSVEQTGVVLALFGIGSLLGTFLGGKLTDRIGFYSIQVASLLFGGLMLIFLQFITQFEWLCVTVFIFTALGDAFRPANSAAFAYYSTPDNRTRAFSLNRLAINLGWAVGGGLGGLFAGIDYRLLFWVDGLTCISAAVYMLAALPRPNHAQTVANAREAYSTVARSAYRDGVYLVFTACMFLYLTAFMQFFSLLPLYFKKQLGAGEGQIGLFMATNGLLIVALEMALVYGLERRVQQQLLISVAGVLLTGVSLFVLTFTQWPGIAWVTIILITVGEMLAMPFLLTFAANRSDDRNRGQYLGLYSMAWALSQVCSPLVGTQLAERFGFQTLWSVMLGLTMVSALGLLWVNRHESALLAPAEV
ncbi:MFS transporter [Fibrivirga algicola]|uniref:MFS transporter n=1 Tax=Fibrivirga algicola TaxID=2950420 RepID=A0ABX0QIN9_9BACT|nr:MFS transporter [Fibrivirga algicola]NID11121.1 MFS transporter [Fibrivirga algicola]